MLNFTGALKVYVATEAADLRKSFTGLWALTLNALLNAVLKLPKSGGLKLDVLSKFMVPSEL